MNTPFLDQVYDQVNFDRKLVFKFFTIFSLFEHALKKVGFTRASRNGYDIQPDWDRFARAIEENFDPSATAELQNAVDYMLAKPVMRQVQIQEQLEFFSREMPEIQSETVWLSVLIRGVRNNLFHGAKFSYDPDRDSKLIHASLVILEAWSHCNSRVEGLLARVR